MRKIILLDTGVTQIDSWQNLGERKVINLLLKSFVTAEMVGRLTHNSDDTAMRCEPQSQRKSYTRGWNSDLAIALDSKGDINSQLPA